MVEHDELMRRAVTGLRASRSPAPDAQARVLARLELQLGGPSGGDGSAAGGGSAVAGGSTAPVTIGWIAKVVGVTAGLTAGGLLLLRVGAGMLRASAADEQPSREEQVARVEVQPTEEQVARADPPPAIEEEPVASSSPLATPGKPRVAKPSEVEPADTLAAEAALLGAAKRASAPAAALELLDQHAREYPSGAMASEREVLAVKALCQLERTDDARGRARSLIATRPSLPLLDRMRRDCPALADLLRQTAP